MVKKLYMILMCAQGLVSAQDGDLIDIQKINPCIRLDIKYATSDNFLSRPVYSAAKAYLRKEVAYKLDQVQRELEKQGLGLKVWDAYRPLSAQRELWAMVLDDRYMADPAKGSNHNRGAAVDVTLVYLTGNELNMPTGFDDFSEKAHYDFMELSEEQLHNRALLAKIMQEHGFIPLATEWWHFSDCNANEYPLLDISFEELEQFNR